MLATVLMSLAVAIVPIYMILLVHSFIVFDRWLLIVHERHHAWWVRQGRPIGFFWTPPGAATFSGGWARSHVCWTFLGGGGPPNDSELEAIRRNGACKARWAMLLVPTMMVLVVLAFLSV